MTAHATIKATSRALLAITAMLFLVLAPHAAAQDAGTPNPPTQWTVSGNQPAAVPAARQADKVAIITLKGEIDRWSELSIKRRLTQAEQSGANAVVIEIDSPGGEVGAVLEICNAIKGSTIPNTVAWVRPDAYSGGAIVALACREIVTSTPASMGDAFPITFGPMGVRGLNPDERTKFLPPLLTEVADSARRHGYDEFLVQAMVVDGIELWSVRDRETGDRWFLNEAEYKVLFEGDPTRGKPALTSVTGGRAADQSLAPRPSGKANEDSDRDDDQNTEDEGEQSDEDPDPTPKNSESTDDQLTDQDDPTTDNEGESPSDNTPQPEGPAAFTPAAPGLADLSGTISDTLSVVSTRPTFTESDRGRFTDLAYITDGTGPIVLRDDQLRAFGFSTTIIQSDEQLRAYFNANEMVRTEQSWSEVFVRFMMNPVVRGVLIVVLLVGLFIEMSSPGMIIPGALAVAALAAIIAPPMLVGMAGWWEVVALALGAAFLFIELIVIPGFGIFGILGLIALFVGLVGTFIPDGSGGMFSGNQEASKSMLYGIATVLLSTVTASVVIYFIARNFGSFPLLSRLVLADTNAEPEFDPIAAMAPPEPELNPGDTGTAATPLLPTGRVRVGNTVIDATAQRGTIEAGEQVQLIRRESFEWIVKQAAPKPDQPQDSDPDHSDTETDHA